MGTELNSFYTYCKTNGFNENKPIHSFLSFFREELNNSKTSIKYKLELAQKMEFICNEKLKFQKHHAYSTLLGRFISCVRNLFKYGKCQNSAQLGKDLASDFRQENAQALKIQRWFKHRKRIKDTASEKLMKEHFTIADSNVQRIADAQIVCFAEIHGANDKEIGLALDHLYKKVDAALVEIGDITLNPEIESGSAILRTHYSNMQKIIRFKSWDDPSKQCPEMGHLFKLYRDFQQFGSPTFNFKEFFNKYENFLDNTEQKSISLLMVLADQGKFSTMPGLVETYILWRVCNVLFKSLMKNTEESFLKRNITLCNTVNTEFSKRINRCKKVFLTCGEAHVICMKKEEEAAVKLVKECFQAKKYVILKPLEKPKSNTPTKEQQNNPQITFAMGEMFNYIFSSKEGLFLLENAIRAIRDQPLVDKETFERTRPSSS